MSTIIEGNRASEVEFGRDALAMSGGLLLYREQTPSLRAGQALEINPLSVLCIVITQLEVNGRGHWDTSDKNINQLEVLYQEIEDLIKGVSR